MIKEFIEMPKLERWVGKTFKFLSPNTWTTISLIVALAGFWAVIQYQIALAVILYSISNVCDMIDGRVARFSNRSSKLGAFWDGTVDRFVDALLILSFYFLRFEQSQQHIAMLLFWLLFATLLPPFIVAYANHRGAVPDPTEKVIWRIGFRIEYAILLLVGIALNPLSAAWSYYMLLASLAMMSVTVVQSIVLVFLKSKLYR